jgi:hypothetical protein
VKQSLPAILVVYDEDTWTDWVKENTGHLASIDYETLAVKIHRRASRKDAAAFADEAALAELSAAVRWLRSRPSVLPNRLRWHRRIPCKPASFAMLPCRVSRGLRWDCGKRRFSRSSPEKARRPARKSFRRSANRWRPTRFLAEST